MKVEVGDWVRFRGGTRIYEVQGVQPANSEPTHFIEVIGSKLLHRVETIETHVSVFWVKKVER